MFDWLIKYLKISKYILKNCLPWYFHGHGNIFAACSFKDFDSACWLSFRKPTNIMRFILIQNFEIIAYFSCQNLSSFVKYAVYINGLFDFKIKQNCVRTRRFHWARHSFVKLKNEMKEEILQYKLLLVYTSINILIQTIDLSIYTAQICTEQVVSALSLCLNHQEFIKFEQMCYYEKHWNHSIDLSTLYSAVV